MTPSETIDRLGGTSKVADLCEITTGAVSQWKENGIPKPWRKFLEATHPEAFGLPPKQQRRRKAA